MAASNSGRPMQVAIRSLSNLLTDYTKLSSRRLANKYTKAYQFENREAHLLNLVEATLILPDSRTTLETD
jgi:hypothetical protein